MSVHIDLTIAQLYTVANELLPLTETPEGCELLARDAEKVLPSLFALRLITDRMIKYLNGKEAEPSRLRRLA